MKSSDPKQILVLSIVAVGAVGYLGFSLFASGGSGAARMQASKEREKETVETASLGIELLRDPFSHPKLLASARREADQRRGDVPPSPMPPSEIQTGGPSTMGSLDLRPLPGTKPLQAPAPETQPAETAGPDRKSGEAPRYRVALSAIVRVERQMAFLSIDGRESRAFQAGSLVAAGLRLVAIREGSVVLRTARGVVEIKVGEEGSL